MLTDQIRKLLISLYLYLSNIMDHTLKKKGNLENQMFF